MSITREAQEIISDEEDRLKRVIQSLESQMELARRRLKTESERAQDFTAQLVAARRDSDKQLIASDEAVSHGIRDRKREEIEEIEKLLNRPYFARMVLLEEESSGKDREIEFLLGTVSNSDCRIIDWRKAPISKLYYEYKEGEHYDEEILGRDRIGTIQLRHKLDIEAGELKALTCRFGNFMKTPEGWAETKGRVRGGGARKVGELPDVLSLITKEQFRAITQDAESAVVIQGIAGSGKTTVALHRLSWLLTAQNSDLQSSDALILVRSKPLRAYIEQSLPGLDIDGVACLTFELWVRKVLAKFSYVATKIRAFSNEEITPSVERILRSSAMFRCVDFYVQMQRERLVKHLETQFSKIPLLAARMETARSWNLPSLKFVRMLVGAIKGQEKEAWYPKVFEELQSCERRLILYREDIGRILESTKTVLERDDSRLLDENLLKEAKVFLEKERNLGRIGLAEAVLVLLLASQKGETLPRPAGQLEKFKHVVLDEVQDFSAPELALIVEIVDKLSSLTLTGDAAQAISHTGTFPGWDMLRKYKNLEGSSHFVELTVSHRSTAAIMHLADHVQGEQRTKGGRPGKPPLWFSCRNENEATKECIAWLLRISEKYPEAVVAVLTDTRETARYLSSLLRPTFSSALQTWDDSTQSFQEGILVMSVQDAKGLEFEHVLIWNPSDKSYPRTQLGRNKLYVAITRAEEHLCIVTHDKPSSLLPPLASPLVRGIEPDLEEDDGDDEPKLLDALPSDG